MAQPAIAVPIESILSHGKNIKGHAPCSIWTYKKSRTLLVECSPIARPTAPHTPSSASAPTGCLPIFACLFLPSRVPFLNRFSGLFCVGFQLRIVHLLIFTFLGCRVAFYQLLIALRATVI